MQPNTMEEPLTQVRQGKQDDLDQIMENKQNETTRRPEGTPAAAPGEIGGESMAHNVMSLYSNSNADKVIKGNYEDRTKTDSTGKEQETKLGVQKKETETHEGKETKEARRHEEGKLNEMIDAVNTTREESMTPKAEVKQMRKDVTTKTGIREVREEVKKEMMETEEKIKAKIKEIIKEEVTTMKQGMQKKTKKQRESRARAANKREGREERHGHGQQKHAR